jgi:diguanylate cyclase (GGDEF)-like protein/PAS domain S-box-containing protein
MARAVQVFREAMLRADVLSAERLATQRFLDTVLEHVPAPIAVKDARTLRIVHINRAAEAFMGLPRAAMIGHSVRELFPDENATAFEAKETETLGAGEAMVEDGVLLHTPGNGSRLAIITRVAIPGADGAPQYLLSMIEDVTERRRAEQRVSYMASYDVLTDLPNRAQFTEQLAKAMRAATRGGSRAAVLCIDLDHFKEVNDSLGHAAGDKLLRTVANRMRQCVRADDTLARLGGDEFAVIQSGVRQPRDAELLARRLLDSIREPVELDGQQVFVGMSVGIAFSTPGIDEGELVKQADMALYEAKATGRGGFSVFAPEMDVRQRERRALEQDLRAAIGTDQIQLHYQPQVDLATGAIVGAEALMRWNRPGHGPVPPDSFIPIAEDTGLIGPLGVWLLGEACREATRWPEHLLIAVNFSPVQFRQNGLLGAVKDALAATGLDPRRLELEVTERILLHDTEETLAILAALRALGVRLAMDDFGTGYASLGYLQKFRFDKIKIDRSFVKNLATDPNASAIVRAVVGLSESLGMCTNAEGVEEEEQADLLRAHGCMEAQGYRFWRPMPAAELRELVQPVRAAAHADVG